MKTVQLLLVVLFLSFAACNSSSPKPRDPNVRPAWIITPSMNGNRGAVGVAGRTYDQSISTQRKLAIKRALDELSLQTKVRVKLSMTKEEVVTNNSASLRTNDHSTYNANSNISAHIQDSWMDRYTGELYVWMVLNK